MVTVVTFFYFVIFCLEVQISLEICILTIFVVGFFQHSRSGGRAACDSAATAC